MNIIFAYIEGCGDGVGGVACFQLELSESVFKTAGVRVWSQFFKTAVSLSLESVFKTAGVGVGTFVAITDSNVY